MQRPSRIFGLFFAAVLAVVVPSKPRLIRSLRGPFKSAPPRRTSDSEPPSTRSAENWRLDSQRLCCFQGCPATCSISPLDSRAHSRISPSITADTDNWLPASADFQFTGGPITVPDIPGEVFAPFTFTGSLLLTAQAVKLRRSSSPSMAQARRDPFSAFGFKALNR